LDMKLEVAVVPVADVDRAKAFCQHLGWREDADIAGDRGHHAPSRPVTTRGSLIGQTGARSNSG